MSDEHGQNEPGGDDHGHDDLDPAIAIDDARPRGPARKALARLDRVLDRERRRKGGGWVWPIAKFIFFAFIVAPIAWVLLYRFIEAPGTILMAQRAMSGEDVTRDVVKLEDISPHLVRAVIAAEDAKFCRHEGFDTQAIQAALMSNAKGKKVRGGSTISQQTAKNLFLWPQRDWVRKGLETYFTGLTEFLWPKKRIMEAYLNAAEWGDGLFGAEAAAQARFGVSAKNLTPRQAALLASVLPSPNNWRADKPGPYVRRRAASIEARMWVLRNEGLDLCVLDPGAAPPPRGKKPAEPDDVLPPLAELPPSIVTEDQPIGADQPEPAEALTIDDVPLAPLEPEEEPTAPADAPGLEPAANEGPVNIAP